MPYMSAFVSPYPPPPPPPLAPSFEFHPCEDPTDRYDEGVPSPWGARGSGEDDEDDEEEEDDDVKEDARTSTPRRGPPSSALP